MTPFKLDAKQVHNGSAMILGVSYGNPRELTAEESRGRAEPKIFEYVAFKAGGLWYLTGGAGKTPQAAGWGAVERWLSRDSRTLHYVKIWQGEAVQVWPLPETWPDGDPNDIMACGYTRERCDGRCNPPLSIDTLQA